MGIEQPLTGNVDSKIAERKEKGADGFRKSYNTALSLRDFERGWGKYENKEIDPFGTQVSLITERCKNMAEAMIKGDSKVLNTYAEQIIKQIEIAEKYLIRFEEKENLHLISPIEYQLDALRESIKTGDAVKILESAVRLGSYYGGFMYANELLLANADEASGSYNSVTKKTGKE